jgi:hypothetical protein
VKRTHPKQVVTALLSAGLLLAALVPAASAAPPKWSITATQAATFVNSGSAQAFDITITNNGPSNISSLYLVAASDNSGSTASVVADEPVYITSSRAGACSNPDGGLLCSFGAVNKGVTVTVTVAYTMPLASGNTILFGLNTTGLVVGGNNSHGDAIYTTPQVVTILPATEINRGGKFTLANNDSVSNDQAVSSSNVQATKLLGLEAYLGASVADGSGVTFSCPKAKCKAKLFGEWSDVNVDGGAKQTTPFGVQITIAMSALPNNLVLADVVLYHVVAGGAVETISQACVDGAAVPSTGCLDDVYLDADGNLVILALVFYNGGYKGAY